jgi:hypothetical protein
VERDGEFDDAKPGAEMAAGDGDGVDRLLPQLVGKLCQLRGLEPSEIGGPADRVEKRGFDGQRTPSVYLI